MAPDESGADKVAELTETIRLLRVEIERLRDELREVQRSHHETPPHYL